MFKIFLFSIILFVPLSIAHADEFVWKTTKIPNSSNMDRIYYVNGIVAGQDELNKFGGIIKSEGKIPDGVFKGDSPNGLYVNEIIFKDGERIGLKAYSKDGTLRMEDETKNGIRQYKMYYPNGKLRSKGIIDEDGCQEDQSYDVNGNLEYEQFWRDKLKCKKVYSFKAYYPNGRLKSEGIADKKETMLLEKVYDANGKLIKEFKGNVRDLEN